MKRSFEPIFPLALLFVFVWLIFVFPASHSRANAPTPTGQTLDRPATEAEYASDLTRLRVPKPTYVRAVYATAWMAGSAKWFPRIVRFIHAADFNSLVVDVKDDTGTISYRSEVPLARAINAFEPKIPDPRTLLETLRANHIYPIARIVAFKDPFLAQHKPEWAVRDKEGGFWRDRKGLMWVDPNNRVLWDYLVDIAKEAVGLGFQEIQFDYVRFTSDGDTKRCAYPYNNGATRQDVIRDFLQYARAKLKPYQIPVSADIFGLTTSVMDDQGIGQQYEKIIASVDVVCPMVYPSHYAPGTFGLKNPDLAPYQTVFHGVRDAKKRLEKSGNLQTQIRPWLQDFSLGNHYGRAEIKSQIQAVSDAGIKEWIFWNPSCRYQIKKYQ